ncbi:MAG: DUF2079 domain-containing protein, partial [Lentisphaeria bacterium]|nr:DUF2079 domain-containing protein [Lentisphaeria bacterium]
RGKTSFPAKRGFSPPRDTIDPCREQSIYQSRFVSGNLWLAAAAALLMGGTAGFWTGGLEMTDPVLHQLRFAAHWLVQSCAAGAAGAALLFVFFQKSRAVFDPLCGIFILAGCVSACFGSFTALAASLFFITAALVRTGGAKELVFRESRYWILVPSLLAAAVFCLGLEQQTVALDRMILLFNDWGIYFDGYRKLAENPGSGWGNWCSIGNHWNVCVNGIMAPLVGLFPRVITVFAVNSLLLASAAPLVYCLCRVKGLPRGIAAVCAAAAAFNPLLSNQHTTLLYGYHPVNFLLPAVLLFFIAREKKWKWAMVLCFLFCCGIKETFFVFASGSVLIFLCRKKWKHAAVAAGVCAGLFLLVTHVLLPRCDGSGSYFQMFQYQGLGNSMGEVLLSPFMRPRAFWGMVFRPGNLSFLLLLLLPVLGTAWAAPRYLLAALPLLGGIIIKDTYQGKFNIVQQYGFEITVWLLIAMISGAAELYRQKRFSAGAAAALLFGSLAGFWFVGKTPVGGPYSFTAVRRIPDIRMLRERLTALIPADAVVAVSQKWAGQLVGTHRHLLMPVSAEKADYRVVDFSDSFASSGELMLLRDRLLAARSEHPVAMFNARGCRIIVFKRGNMPWQMPFIVAGTPEKLAPRALVIPLKEPGMRARAVYVPSSRKILIFFGVSSGCRRDAEISVELMFRGMKHFYRFNWGYGLYPAYAMTPGQSFVAELAVPSGWQSVEQLKIDLKIMEKPTEKK